MLRVGNDCKCVFWGYQISPKRSTKEGEAVQYFDDQFFDLLRLVTFFQSSSSYLHSFVLSDMNCNAELGINLFRHAVPKGGREGGGLFRGSSSWYGKQVPTSTFTQGVTPLYALYRYCCPKGYGFQPFWSNRVSILSI